MIDSRKSDGKGGREGRAGPEESCGGGSTKKASSAGAGAGAGASSVVAGRRSTGAGTDDDASGAGAVREEMVADPSDVGATTSSSVVAGRWGTGTGTGTGTDEDTSGAGAVREEVVAEPSDVDSGIVFSGSSKDGEEPLMNGISVGTGCWRSSG